MADTPASTYGALLSARRAEAAALDQRAARISLARLFVFLTGVVLAAGAVFGGWLSGGWIALPALAFLVLVVVHDRVLLARDRAERAAAWYEHGLARLADRWSGIGPAGDRFAEAEHLYSQDLDLFGEGSLFQLLNTARTQAGEDTLAAWLLAPADRGEVLSRQAAVRDLRPRVTLRERLAIAGADVRTAVQPAALVEWADGARLLGGVWPQAAAVALTILTPVAVTAWAMGGPIALPVAALATIALLARAFRRRTAGVMHAAGRPARELAVVGEVCRILRADAYAAPRLAALRAALASEEGEVDQAVRGVHRLVEMYDWQHNIIFAPIAALLFWELHCAFAVERWRARHGREVAQWLRQIGEFEALSALATYAYEHPADPFPELVEASGPPLFEATALAHPFLAPTDAVPNDVTLGAVPRVQIVSGSNMSGKTTLLRSTGVSAVMALMGAPVRAASLRLSPAAIGATLRIEESLQAGRSRFYAEVLKLRQIVAAAQAGPTLFLFDELFHGTNSHDRREGARGLLRSLLALETVGLVTTHDLALADIADALAPRICNAHFDDTLVDGEMHFDYRLKPGPVTRSNALAIMRAVGLTVSEDS